MEPKIQDGDLVLIRQQSSYEPNDYVFVIHNQLPKLKKILKKDDKIISLSILKSVKITSEDKSSLCCSKYNK